MVRRNGIIRCRIHSCERMENMGLQHKQKTKKKRGRWFVHLVVFVMVQVIFYLRDTFGWKIFNLNNVGLWFEETVRPITWLQLYDLQILNYITLVWGVLLLLDGILSFYNYWGERRKKTSTYPS